MTEFPMWAKISFILAFGTILSYLIWKLRKYTQGIEVEK